MVANSDQVESSGLPMIDVSGLTAIFGAIVQADNMPLIADKGVAGSLSLGNWRVGRV
jgi:hypothetical protein